MNLNIPKSGAQPDSIKIGLTFNISIEIFNLTLMAYRGVIYGNAIERKGVSYSRQNKYTLNWMLQTVTELHNSHRVESIIVKV